MLLIISNSKDATVDYLAPVLTQNGVEYFRFDTDLIIQGAAFRYINEQCELLLGGRWCKPQIFSNVWYRRPESLQKNDRNLTPEEIYALDEWAEVFEGFLAHIPKSRWMNHPSTNANASHKIEQLTIAKSIGFRIPSTLITQDPMQLRSFYAEHNESIIVKPMARGYIERPMPEKDSLIYTNLVRSKDLENLGDLSACPTLFQALINKKSDIRITVVDEFLIAVELIKTESNGEQLCDIRRDNMAGVKYSIISLPKDNEDKIRRLMQHYALRFSAIDMVVDKNGTWYFLEVNANGQWAWLDTEAGTDIASAFVKSFR